MSERAGNLTRSIIPTGMTLRGKIEGTEELPVAGTVDGEIHLRGTLRLLASGCLRGRGSGWEALVAGQVDATLMASERAEIFSTARVEGEIRARRLTMAEGALVNARIISCAPPAHPSRLEWIEGAVGWEEARRLPVDESGGAGR